MTSANSERPERVNHNNLETVIIPFWMLIIEALASNRWHMVNSRKFGCFMTDEVALMYKQDLQFKLAKQDPHVIKATKREQHCTDQQILAAATSVV